MNLQRDQQKQSIAYLQNCDICDSLIFLIQDLSFKVNYQFKWMVEICVFVQIRIVSL
jgi:hypothetical protein